MPANTMHWAVYATVDSKSMMMASFYIKGDADDYQYKLSSYGWNAWVESLDD